jgi:predicted phage terminase large subunit-like protein
MMTQYTGVHTGSCIHRYPGCPSGKQIFLSLHTMFFGMPRHSSKLNTTWLIKNHDYYLLDVFRARMQYPELKQRVRELANRHRANSVLIEDKGSGTSLIQDLRFEGSLRPIAIIPEKDKITRLHAQTAKIEAGQVFLPERAAWLRDFQAEMKQFPNGRYDDQVDSVSQFLNWIDNHRYRPATFIHINYMGR